MNEPRRGQRLSGYVASVVYGPSILAYVLVCVESAWLALTLYLLFMSAAAVRLRFFRNLGDWPVTSRFALYLSPAYVALGFFFRVDAVGYWAMLPATLYSCAALVGSIALRRANLEL